MIRKSLIASFAFMLMTQYCFAKDNDISFSLRNEQGKVINLKDFKGKVVVLEWLNHGCPFVKKHYVSKNMQSLQKEFTEKGVIWLSIISSAKGKQGHVDAKGASEDKIKHLSLASHILLDETGEVGKKFKAITTPHMFIIDANQKLVYQGAIDSIASTDVEDVAKADPFFKNALLDVLAGRKIKNAKNKPYGCSVKY